jgi:orotidine-5'-phosphate decarboxylase
MTTQLIVALDGMNEQESLRLAETLCGEVWGFKVNDLLLQCGVSVVTELKKFGGVFADPKLHDIPNTVGNAVRRLVDVGADLITVHASGGAPMLSEAARQAGPAKILAVTVLTSFDDHTAQSIFRRNAGQAVHDFVALAENAGIHGIVCSPQELNSLKTSPLLKVTPGVRPSWYGKADDQTRVMTPQEAASCGADYLVIGRPITADSNPLAAVRRIVAELR